LSFSHTIVCIATGTIVGDDIGIDVGEGVRVDVGVGVGAWAVMVATMDLAIAVMVAETLGVEAGVGPQAAMKVAMRTKANSFFMVVTPDI
jgi:hypothetical protein